MLIVPPDPNDSLANKRINKMWSNGHRKSVIIRIKREAIDVNNTGINHQGVVLQRSMIRPKMIDYAFKVTNSDAEVKCEWIFISDRRGAVETVRGTGNNRRQWEYAFFMNLRRRGDEDPPPTIQEERWI
jgi:hypothetical protein